MFLREHTQALEIAIKPPAGPRVGLRVTVKETTEFHVSPLTMKAGDTMTVFVPINVVMQDSVRPVLHFIKVAI